MPIILQPYASACYNFKKSVNGDEKKITVVIVPLRIEESGGVTKVSWACNYGKECRNFDCEYAHGNV